MPSRIAAIIRKEIIQIRRDRRTLAIVLALPVMQLLLFGYAINTVVDHMSTVVFDESRDADSRALIAAYQNSRYFDVVAEAHTPDDLGRALDSGRAKVGLHIPPDFGDRVLRGESGLVQLIIDGSDPNAAQTALFAGSAVAQAGARDLSAARINRRSGAAGFTIDLRPIVRYNPGMLSVNFMVPGIIGLILRFQTLRGIMLKGVGMAFLWPSVLPLAVFGAFVFSLSVWRFQKRIG